MKTNTDRIKTAWVGISPWLIIGAMIILAPLFIFMTLDNVNKQKQHVIRVFMEKGDALIRSFEAGVRTGMTESQVDFFHLQKLLMEMAQQDIDFITLVDARGTILADSDPALIGESFGKELDLDSISRSAKLEWRLVPNQDGIDTFQVFRRFSPLVPYDERFHAGVPPGNALRAGEGTKGAAPSHVIFIGMNVEPIETARKDAVRHTVMMSLFLLFIGASGIVSLFLAQGYRSSRISLSRIKAFSDNLVENMPIGLIGIDNEGRIMSFNQTAESILKLAATEAAGGKAADVLPLPFREIINEMDVEKGIIDKETDCATADGKMIRLEIIATVLKEEGGNFLGYVLLFKDLTEMQHLKREIVRSQRLASLGNLAAGIAHEIRNPLSSIKGFATYFKERYRDNPTDGETADIMVREVERLNRVISQLLEFARPMSLEKKEASLQALIRQSLKMIEGQAREKNIVVQADLARDVPQIAVDEDKMKQVLLNLYLNALETMGKGGVLKARLSRFDRRTVNIAVSDTGEGIDEKKLANIFDPYFTTKPSGTGLGLSIVNKIIEAHGGEISVTSTAGEGTTFSILLPATKGETEGHEKRLLDSGGG